MTGYQSKSNKWNEVVLLSRTLIAEVNIISFQKLHLFTATGLALNLGV